MIVALLALLLSPAFSAEVPYYLRDLDTQKDVGAVNENFRALADAIKVVQTDVDANEVTAASANQVASTYTILTNGDQTISATTTPGDTITGSTITMTVVGSSSWVEACAVFSATHTSSGLAFDVLVDGVRSSGGTNGVGYYSSSLNDDQFHSLCVPLGAIAAGSHSFSFVIWKTGGLLAIRKVNPPFYFSAKEHRP